MNSIYSVKQKADMLNFTPLGMHYAQMATAYGIITQMFRLYEDPVLMQRQ